MVEHNLVTPAAPCGIGTVVYVFHLTAAETEETHYHIVAFAKVDGIVSQGNARIGGRLSGNSGVGGDIQLRLQVDIAAHIEDDGLGIISFQRLSQGTSTRVVEVGDVPDFSAPSTSDITSVSFCTGEGGDFFLCHCCQSADSHYHC